MHPDPDRRPDPTQALSHEWLRSFDSLLVSPTVMLQTLEDSATMRGSFNRRILGLIHLSLLYMLVNY